MWIGFTVMRFLTTGICSEKCVVMRFCHCANIIGSTLYKSWNLAWTWPPYGWKSFQASFSRIGRFHPNWRCALASNFPPQSAYLEFPEILTTIIYAVRHWPHDCFWLRIGTDGGLLWIQYRTLRFLECVFFVLFCFFFFFFCFFFPWHSN